MNWEGYIAAHSCKFNLNCFILYQLIYMCMCVAGSGNRNAKDHNYMYTSLQGLYTCTYVCTSLNFLTVTAAKLFKPKFLL